MFIGTAGAQCSANWHTDGAGDSCMSARLGAACGVRGQALSAGTVEAVVEDRRWLDGSDTSAAAALSITPGTAQQSASAAAGQRSSDVPPATMELRGVVVTVVTAISTRLVWQSGRVRRRHLTTDSGVHVYLSITARGAGTTPFERDDQRASRMRVSIRMTS